MRRYELGMSLDYVSNWTIVDAVREIFQNSLDEEIQNPENKWYFNYNEETETLQVGNKLSRLSTQSLLLGNSSKRGDINTIGQHGEGYKVATIVLLRNGCGVNVYNYNEKEIWKAKIIKSRRYQQDIGVFDVESLGAFKKPVENNLIFEITNINKEAYEAIKESNLWLQKDLGKVIESKGYGRALLDSKYAGKVFVKGLFVCSKEQLTYGYDLEPSLIDLDRDRGLVDSFNLQYNLGKLIIHTGDTDFISDVKEYWDGYYIRCFDNHSSPSIEKVYDDALKKFTGKYGEDAIPCTETEQFNRLKKNGYNAVMVNESQNYYIVHSSSYNPKVEPDDFDLGEEVSNWYDKIKSFIPEELIEESDSIIEMILEKL